MTCRATYASPPDWTLTSIHGSVVGLTGAIVEVLGGPIRAIEVAESRRCQPDQIHAPEFVGLLIRPLSGTAKIGNGSLYEPTFSKESPRKDAQCIAAPSVMDMCGGRSNCACMGSGGRVIRGNVLITFTYLMPMSVSSVCSRLSKVEWKSDDETDNDRREPSRNATIDQFKEGRRRRHCPPDSSQRRVVAAFYVDDDVGEAEVSKDT